MNEEDRVLREVDSVLAGLAHEAEPLRRLSQQLAAQRTRATAIRLAKQAHDFGDKTLAKLAATGATKGLDCASGCSWCCYFHVDTTWPEVLQLAEAISKWPNEDRDELVAKLRSTARKIEGLDIDRRAYAKIPCSLLKDKKCLAYADRPLACRACNSFSRHPCKRSLRPGGPDIQGSSVVLQAYLPLSNGIAQDLKQEGLSATVELNAGLLQALTGDAPEWLR